MSDVLIHFDKTLDMEAQHDLEDQVRSQNGVRMARVSTNANHLMLVEFDQQQTRSIDILHTVQNKGFQAELIGL